MARRVRYEHAGQDPETSATEDPAGSTRCCGKKKAAKRRAKPPCPFSIDKTRLTLLEKIKDPGDREHWDFFLRVYGAFIKNIARCRGLDKQRADDLYIVVLSELNKKISQYTPAKGGFRTWLGNMVRRRCIDLFRKDKRFPEPLKAPKKKSGETLKGQPEDYIRDTENDFQAIWDKEEAEAVIKIARGIAKSKVTAHNWQIFECRVLRDWPVARVCETLGVTPNVVNVAKAKVKPVFDAAMIEAQARLDRGPLTPFDRKSLLESLPLPTYAIPNKP